MTMQRDAIIAEAMYRLGRKGQTLTLSNAYDAITLDITTRHACYFKIAAGNLVVDQNYIALPSDYRSRNWLIVNSDEVGWLEPDPFLVYTKTRTIEHAQPDRYTVVEDDAKFYLSPKPDATYAYEFRYAAIHPANSGSTYEHLLGASFDETIVLGMAWKACQIIRELRDEADYWQGLYIADMQVKVDRKAPTTITVRSGAWDKNWGRLNQRRG